MSVPEQRLITGAAVSRSGRISVETTEMGLPTAVVIDRGELRRDPALLAGEILRLCRQGSARARLARRGELATAGVERDVLDSFGLPTADEVALAELVDETEYDYAPRFRRG